jgi:hypothetical protein
MASSEVEAPFSVNASRAAARTLSRLRLASARSGLPAHSSAFRVSVGALGALDSVADMGEFTENP